MAVETVLSDAQIIEILEENRPKHDGPDKAIAVSRAIEQAVMQALEIRALRKDAKRIDWLESCEDSHGFCHAGYGDYLYYVHQEEGYPSVREVIDTAMEERND